MILTQESVNELLEKTPMQKYFSEDENCLRELAIARSKLKDEKTTESEYDQMQKTLLIMYVDCNPAMKQSVLDVYRFAACLRSVFELIWLSATRRKI